MVLIQTGLRFEARGANTYARDVALAKNETLDLGTSIDLAVNAASRANLGNSFNRIGRILTRTATDTKKAQLGFQQITDTMLRAERSVNQSRKQFTQFRKSLSSEDARRFGTEIGRLDHTLLATNRTLRNFNQNVTRNSFNTKNIDRYNASINELLPSIAKTSTELKGAFSNQQANQYIKSLDNVVDHISRITRETSQLRRQQSSSTVPSFASVTEGKSNNRALSLVANTLDRIRNRTLDNLGLIETYNKQLQNLDDSLQPLNDQFIRAQSNLSSIIDQTQLLRGELQRQIVEANIAASAGNKEEAKRAQILQQQLNTIDSEIGQRKIAALVAQDNLKLARGRVEEERGSLILQRRQIENLQQQDTFAKNLLNTLRIVSRRVLPGIAVSGGVNKLFPGLTSLPVALASSLIPAEQKIKALRFAFDNVREGIFRARVAVERFTDTNGLQRMQSRLSNFGNTVHERISPGFDRARSSLNRFVQQAQRQLSQLTTRTGARFDPASSRFINTQTSRFTQTPDLGRLRAFLDRASGIARARLQETQQDVSRVVDNIGRLFQSAQSESNAALKPFRESIRRLYRESFVTPQNLGTRAGGIRGSLSHIIEPLSQSFRKASIPLEGALRQIESTLGRQFQNFTTITGGRFDPRVGGFRNIASGKLTQTPDLGPIRGLSDRVSGAFAFGQGGVQIGREIERIRPQIEQIAESARRFRDNLQGRGTNVIDQLGLQLTKAHGGLLQFDQLLNRGIRNTVPKFVNGFSSVGGTLSDITRRSLPALQRSAQNVAGTFARGASRGTKDLIRSLQQGGGLRSVIDEIGFQIKSPSGLLGSFASVEQQVINIDDRLRELSEKAREPTDKLELATARYNATSARTSETIRKLQERLERVNKREERRNQHIREQAEALAKRRQEESGLVAQAEDRLKRSKEELEIARASAKLAVTRAESRKTEFLSNFRGSQGVTFQDAQKLATQEVTELNIEQISARNRAMELSNVWKIINDDVAQTSGLLLPLENSIRIQTAELAKVKAESAAREREIDKEAADLDKRIAERNRVRRLGLRGFTSDSGQRRVIQERIAQETKRVEQEKEKLGILRSQTKEQLTQNKIEITRLNQTRNQLVTRQQRGEREERLSASLGATARSFPSFKKANQTLQQELRSKQALALGQQYGNQLYDGVAPGADAVAEYMRGLLPGSDPPLIPGWRKLAEKVGSDYIDGVAGAILNDSDKELEKALKKVRRKLRPSGVLSRFGIGFDKRELENQVRSVLIGKLSNLPIDVSFPDIEKSFNRSIREEDLEGIRQYSYSGDEIANSLLRGNFDPSTSPVSEKDARRFVKAFQDHIDRQPPVELSTVFRGIKSGEFEKELEKIDIGERFKDPGFLSTSIFPHVADAYKGALLEIATNARRGGGLSLVAPGTNTEQPSYFPNEAEYILNAGSPLELVGERDIIFKSPPEGTINKFLNENLKKFGGEIPDFYNKLLKYIKDTGTFETRTVKQFAQLRDDNTSPSRAQIANLRNNPTIFDSIRSKVSLSDLEAIRGQGEKVADKFISGVAQSVSGGNIAISNAASEIIRYMVEGINSGNKEVNRSIADALTSGEPLGALSFGKSVEGGIKSSIDASTKYVADNLSGSSPPPLGPLSKIDIGGFNTGRAWGTGLTDGILSVFSGDTTLFSNVVPILDAQFSKLTSTTLSGFNKIGNAAASTIDSISTRIPELTQGVIDAGASILDSVTLGYSRIITIPLRIATNAVTQFGGLLGKITAFTLSNATNIFTGGMNAIVNILLSFARPIAQAIAAPLDRIIDLIRNTIGLIPKLILAPFAFIGRQIPSLIKGILSPVISIFNTITKVIPSRIRNLVSGVFNNVRDTATDIVTEVGEHATNILTSPLRGIQESTRELRNQIFGAPEVEDTADSVDNLGRSFQDAAPQVDVLAEGMNGLFEQLRGVESAIFILRGSSGNLLNAFSLIKTQLASLNPLLKVAIAGVTAVFAGGIRSAPFRGIIDGFKDTGVSLQVLREAAGDTVDDINLLKQSNVALAGATGQVKQEFADALPKLLQISRIQARRTGQSVQFLFESITSGIKRSSPLLIDNTGLVLKVGAANKAYAEQLGKTVDQLTPAEIQLALLNSALEAGKPLIEALGSSAESASEKMGRAFTRVINTINRVAFGFQPTFELFLDFVNETLAPIEQFGKRFATTLYAIGSIVNTVLPDIRESFSNTFSTIFTSLKRFASALFFGSTDAIDLAFNSIASGGSNLLFGFLRVVGTFTGLLVGALNDAKDIISGFLDSLSTILIGGSPPPAGPLKDIDEGGRLIGEAWSEGLLGGLGGIHKDIVDSVNDIRLGLETATGFESFSTGLQINFESLNKTLRRVFTDIGASSLSEIDKRLRNLDLALLPFNAQLKLAEAGLKRITSAADVARDAISRQIERNLQDVIDGNESAAILVRGLDRQFETLKGRRDAQEEIVDQARIQLALAEGQQAEERTILELQRQILQEREKRSGVDRADRADRTARAGGGSGSLEEALAEEFDTPLDPNKYGLFGDFIFDPTAIIAEGTKAFQGGFDQGRYRGLDALFGDSGDLLQALADPENIPTGEFGLAGFQGAIEDTLESKGGLFSGFIDSIRTGIESIPGEIEKIFSGETFQKIKLSVDMFIDTITDGKVPSADALLSQAFSFFKRTARSLTGLIDTAIAAVGFEFSLTEFLGLNDTEPFPLPAAGVPDIDLPDPPEVENIFTPIEEFFQNLPSEILRIAGEFGTKAIVTVSELLGFESGEISDFLPQLLKSLGNLWDGGNAANPPITSILGRLKFFVSPDGLLGRGLGFVNIGIGTLIKFFNRGSGFDNLDAVEAFNVWWVGEDGKSGVSGAIKGFVSQVAVVFGLGELIQFNEDEGILKLPTRDDFFNVIDGEEVGKERGTILFEVARFFYATLPDYTSNIITQISAVTSIGELLTILTGGSLDDNDPDDTDDGIISSITTFFTETIPNTVNSAINSLRNALQFGTTTPTIGDVFATTTGIKPPTTALSGIRAFIQETIIDPVVGILAEGAKSIGLLDENGKPIGILASILELPETLAAEIERIRGGGSTIFDGLITAVFGKTAEGEDRTFSHILNDFEDTIEKLPETASTKLTELETTLNDIGITPMFDNIAKILTGDDDSTLSDFGAGLIGQAETAIGNLNDALGKFTSGEIDFDGFLQTLFENPELTLGGIFQRIGEIITVDFPRIIRESFNLLTTGNIYGVDLSRGVDALAQSGAFDIGEEGIIYEQKIIPEFTIETDPVTGLPFEVDISKTIDVSTGKYRSTLLDSIQTPFINNIFAFFDGAINGPGGVLEKIRTATDIFRAVTKLIFEGDASDLEELANDFKDDVVAEFNRISPQIEAEVTRFISSIRDGILGITPTERALIDVGYVGFTEDSASNNNFISDLIFFGENIFDIVTSIIFGGDTTKITELANEFRDNITAAFEIIKPQIEQTISDIYSSIRDIILGISSDERSFLDSPFGVSFNEQDFASGPLAGLFLFGEKLVSSVISGNWDSARQQVEMQFIDPLATAIQTKLEAGIEAFLLFAVSRLPIFFGFVEDALAKIPALGGLGLRTSEQQRQDTDEAANERLAATGFFESLLGQGVALEAGLAGDAARESLEAQYIENYRGLIDAGLLGFAREVKDIAIRRLTLQFTDAELLEINKDNSARIAEALAKVTDFINVDTDMPEDGDPSGVLGGLPNLSISMLEVILPNDETTSTAVEGYVTDEFLPLVSEGINNALNNNPFLSGVGTLPDQDADTDIGGGLASSIINQFTTTMESNETLANLDKSLTPWARRLIGTSPPPEGPLSNLFTGATNAAKAWISAFSLQLSIFANGDQEAVGTLPYYLNQIVIRFSAMPAAIAESLSSIPTVFWDGFGKPFVQIINYIAEKFNSFAVSLSNGREALANVIPGLELGNFAVFTVPTLSLDPPDFITGAQFGGAFGPGAVLVGERGPEIVAPARQFDVFPNSVLRDVSSLQNQVYERPVYSNATTNNYDQRASQQDFSIHNTYQVRNANEARRFDRAMRGNRINRVAR